MQCDLRSIVEPDWNHRRSYADRRVADHALVSPRARAESTRKFSLEQKGNAAWKANLSTMRVSAQHQVKSSVRRLTVDLRRMRKKNGNAIFRNVSRGLFDIVRTDKNVRHPPLRDRSRLGRGVWRRTR
jgi:hypothetical protein